MSNQNAYLSFVDQTIHYFTRPHESIPERPLVTPAAWRGGDLPPLEELAHNLSSDERAEICKAIAHAMSLNRPARELTETDLPLPSLAPAIAEWRESLKSGVGFVVLRNLPVEEWSEEESELFFWCFGLHLGRPGEQNPEGHLLGHVKDIASDDEPNARLYKTSSEIRFHCDAADVVGLLCLEKAKVGGHSRIASSVTIFNEILKRRPDLIPRLFEPFHMDVRDDGMGANTLPITPCCFDSGVLRTFYHADYYRSVTRHEGISLCPTEQELLDLYEDVANEPGIYVDMDLQPGDVQLISNHTVVHARTAYEDHVEPGRQRHLLRLWLSLQ
jgi:Taurine catabolism dioxygenase TauD, TfdA family